MVHRVVTFLTFFCLGLPLWGNSHPADTDLNQRITTAEIRDYWTNGFGTMSDEDKRADSDWQQGEFLWRNGETYRVEASLAPPFCSLPATGNWVSLSNRYARGLEIIEILTSESPATLTGEYHLPGSTAWVELDCKIESDGRLRMVVPYVPSQWLGDSRRITVRFRMDGVIFNGGEILLRKIDRTRFGFEQFYDQIIRSINRMAASQDINLDGPVAVVRAGRVAGDPVAHHFATARFSAEFSRDVILGLRESGASGAATYEINEELLNLILSESDKDELRRTADGVSASGGTTRRLPDPKGRGGKDNPSLIFGCTPISDSIDLALESQLRCRLENKKSITDQLKEFTGIDKAGEYFDKLGEKVSDLADKSAKKFVTKADVGSKATSSLPAVAMKSAYELYQYKEAWQKEQLPKFIERFEYEVGDTDVRNRGYLLEDSRSGDDCRLVELKVFAHVRGKGFDSAKFLRDKIPSASDAIPSGVSGMPLFGGIITDLVDSGQKAALDTAEEGLRNDLMIRPCRWPEDGSGKGIELRSEEQFRMTTVAGSAIKKEGSREDSPFFAAAKVGKGPLRVSLLTGESGNKLCLEPYTQFFSYEVKPIRVEFNPVAYTVDDVDVSLSMLVFLEDSYDTDELEWDFRDKNGNYLGDLREDDGSSTLSLPHVTTSADTFHSLTINPPDDRDLYPLTVEAVSLAEGCLRTPFAPDRRGTALIHYQAKAFEIQPNRECLSLNSSTVLTAVPADPSNSLDVTWEVVSGDATITRTSPTTATLTVGATPVAEIEIKATGNDTFESYAYFSSGPCFEEVSLTTFFPQELISNPRVGVDYDNQEMSVLTFGESGGFGSTAELPLLLAESAAIYNPGIGQVFGLGAVRTKVTKVESIDADKKLIAVDATYKGMFFTTFNLNRPGIVDPLYSETLGGTYFDDIELSAGEDYDTPLAPVKMVWSPDGISIDVTFEKDISSPTGEGSLSAAWTVINGTKIDEFTLDDTATLVARFSTFEFSPTVQLIVSGTVIDGDESKSYSVQGLTQQRVVYLVGGTRFKAIQEEEKPVLCGGWTGGPDEIGFILDDCCGFINLSDSSEPDYIGVARQNTSSSLLIDNDGVLQSAVSFAFNTDESLPYCSEVRRLKTEKPDPEPYEEPDDPVDPEPGETPEELEGEFKGSPNSGPDTRFPGPDSPDVLAGGGSNSSFTPSPSTFRYPFTNLIAPDGIQMGTFSRSTGARSSTETVISQDSLDYFGGSVRMVGVIRFSSTTNTGYLIERNDPDTDERFFDFWEVDPADGLLTAKTLDSDPISDYSLLGCGDFDGDGTIDLLGGSESNPVGGLVIRKGSAGGFAAGTPFFTNPAGDLLRSAAVVPSTNQVFVSALDASNSDLKIHRLTQSGNVVSTHVIAGLDGNTVSLKAFTDADADGIPDITLHSPALSHFTVVYLKSDGTERTRMNFQVPMFSVVPGPLF